MGGAKSRKGKKAWRKNIDTADVEEFIQQSGHEAQRGPGVQALQDEELFVIDKAPGDLPKSVQSKRARAAKPLKAQVILDGIKAVQAVHNIPSVRPKNPLPPPRQLTSAATAAPPQLTKQQQRKRRSRPGPSVTELWDDEGHVKADPQPSTSGRAAYSSTAATDNDWAAPMPKPTHPALKRRKGQQGVLLAKPAVEIDAAGCSFNPDYDQHQEALAELVALEHKKQLKRELAPRAPPQLVAKGGTPQDELTRLLGDVGEPQQEEQDQQQQGEEGQQQGSMQEEDEDGPTAGAGGSAGRKKTRADRNKLARRRALEKEAEEKAQLKRQRRELERVGELTQQLEEEAAEKEARRLRRQIVAAEKAAIQPPRLGKQRYQPTAAPVLTSDQITGSLRQLPPCFTVTKERFGSLQKRGLVEPRRPVAKRQGRRVAYVVGDRTDKALAGQQELVELRQASAKARKAAKAADAGASTAMDIWGSA